MALTVNTNIASLTAQRNLTGSQNALSTSLQRLSSGLRINSAKDDAAGLAISERFTSQIRGLNQGVRNANDGISLAQTAEGALKEVTSNLQRIRELAVQSANATNSASDRAALKAEADQLVTEINRVATNTKFNGINLLDGSFTSKAFQVGADAGETVSVTSIASAKTGDLGAAYQAASGNLAMAAASTGSNVTINGSAVIASVNDGSGAADATFSAKAIATAVNGSGLGVTATAAATSVGGGGTATDSGSNDATLQITVNGTNIGTVTDAGSADANEAAIEALFVSSAAATGVTASDSSGTLLFTAADGRNISITATLTVGSSSEDMDDFGMGGFVSGTISTTKATVSLTSSENIVVVDAIGGGSNVLGGSNTYVKALTGTAINAIDISSAQGATTAITSIDAALATISASRSDLGSYQSRFESIVANSQTTAENLSAARSRIVDADFAAETAQLTKSQILQQSGIAMLAQANALPQNVLALLQ